MNGIQFVLYLTLTVTALTDQNKVLVVARSSLSTAAASQCLIEPMSYNYADHDKKPSICSAEFDTDDIFNAFDHSKSRLIVNIECVGKTDRLSQNKCICFDVYYNDELNSSVQIRGPPYKCNNHTITLNRNHFRGQTKLQELVLSHVPVVSILPNSFDELSALELISFTHNKFGSSDLPSGLFCNNWKLSKLLLEGQMFSEFPSQLFSCKNVTLRKCLPELTDINITNTAITSFPRVPLGCASNVTLLSLSNSSLRDVYNLCTGSMQLLKTLIIHHNNVSKLKPSTFLNCPSLSHLDLSFNSFTYIKSKWFDGIKSLYKLLMNNNLISHIDGSLASLQITHINLCHNKLKTLPVNVLNGSKSLEQLELQDNLLSDIQPGSLAGLHGLKELDVSSNNLTSMNTLSEAFKYPAKNLYTLTFRHNRITELKKRSFYNFPNLENIFLTNNTITKIDPLSFSTVTNLYTIALGHNNIRTISNDTFKSLKTLTCIQLEHNQLDYIDTDTFPPSVNKLLLDGNRLTWPPCIATSNNLTYLSLSHNNITTLNRKSFCNIEKLITLNLSYNHIELLEQEVFIEAFNLEDLNLNWNRLNLSFATNYFERTSLKKLRLINNQIHSIENLFFHKQLQKLNEIYLANNPIKEIPILRPISILAGKPLIETLDFSSCNITKINGAAFDDLPLLQQINLGNNEMQSFSNLHFDSSKVVVNFANNPIECSCRMRWLKENEALLTFYNLSYCIHPMNKSMVLFRKLPLDQFVCESICFDYEMCSCFSEIDDKAGYILPIIVNCSNRNSTDTPLYLPKTAKEIYLHGNYYNILNLTISYPHTFLQTRKLTLHNSKVSEIEPNVFSAFRYLEELYLHDNDIQFLPKGIFSPLTLLRTLTLQNNLISSLDSNFLLHNNALQVLRLHKNSLNGLSQQTKQTIKDMVYLQTLTLHDNPWICKCDNLSWKSWLNSLDSQQKLGNVQDIKCKNGSSILTTPDDLFLCRTSLLLVTGPLVALLAIACIVMVLIFYHRHFLAVLIFNFFGIRMYKTCGVIEKFEYDAILLFDDEPCNEDYSHVMSAVNQIYGWMTNLGPPYKVMMPLIDIDGGVSWTEEICRGLHSSHKSVIFITMEFIQKGRTVFLFDNAYSMMTQRKTSDVIIILDSKDTLKYIKSKEVSDQRLKAFLRTNNYLLFGDKHFHKKLLYLLPGNVRRFLTVNVNPPFHMDEI